MDQLSPIGVLNALGLSSRCRGWGEVSLISKELRLGGLPPRAYRVARGGDSAIFPPLRAASSGERANPVTTHERKGRQIRG